MPNPKRRHSNTRTRKRRTHDKMAVLTTSSCKQCGNPTPPHRVCSKCGYYGGRPVLQIKLKEKKKG
ncbi:MAG: 50S ribosomal protein L32 [Omnitrophica bacterium RIFCSPHIGHO2_02_FULL_63_14]|nr:MAG: 50S ribosomal protein L32 [Omnitrophica bacterium RIFCSPHIGHO2_02_FULL_63_14]